MNQPGSPIASTLERPQEKASNPTSTPKNKKAPKQEKHRSKKSTEASHTNYFVLFLDILSHIKNSLVCRTYTPSHKHRLVERFNSVTNLMKILGGMA
jgi:hypothetical protein